MQRTAALLDTAHDLQQGFVLKEVAVPDVARDARELLIDDAPRADVRVTDLGVAHLSVGQSDVFAGGVDLIVFILLEQSVDDGRLCHRNGVVFHVVRVAVAESVHDDEGNRGIFQFCHDELFSKSKLLAGVIKN